MEEGIPRERTAEQAAIEVLLVEDDERLARLTAGYLESHHVVVTRVASGPEALREAGRRRQDAVLIDLDRPATGGIALCRELRRQSGVPIILLTARAGEAERAGVREAGADDVMRAPYSSRELLSRVRAAVRRARGEASPPPDLVQVGAVTLEPALLRVTLNGAEIQLTGYEFALLHSLARHAGRVLSRQQLLDLARGAEDAFDRSIDTHISRLRQKLGDDARRPQLLKTIRGAGYMLGESDDS